MFEILLTNNIYLAWGLVLQGALPSTEEYMGREGIPQTPYDQDIDESGKPPATNHASLLGTSVPCCCLANCLSKPRFLALGRSLGLPELLFLCSMANPRG